MAALAVDLSAATESKGLNDIDLKQPDSAMYSQVMSKLFKTLNHKSMSKEASTKLAMIEEDICNKSSTTDIMEKLDQAIICI
ncbi:MAG: hypothetical protein ABI597_11410 [Gammaproteobacteria bacterium]